METATLILQITYFNESDLAMSVCEGNRTDVHSENATGAEDLHG